MTERRGRRAGAVEEPMAATDDATVDEAIVDDPTADDTAADQAVADEATVDATVEPAPAASAESEGAPADSEPAGTAEAAPDAAAADDAAGSPAQVVDQPLAPGEAAAEPAAPEAEPTEEAIAAAVETTEPAPAPAAEPGRGRRAAPAAPAPTSPRESGPRGLRAKYLADVVPAMTKQFEYANPNMVPRLDKIIVNIGLGEALTNAKAVDAALGDLQMITGQRPIVTKARRSIAQFKIRTGNPIGLKVTLRGPRMWDFLERLLLLALPRIRDFRGLPSRSFDGRGNYSLGLREQIAFPEIDYDKVDRLRGLEVSIVTTAKSDEESKRLLELLGMPFAS
jgi:large subunit ribosomal protein L5